MKKGLVVTLAATRPKVGRVAVFIRATCRISRRRGPLSWVESLIVARILKPGSKLSTVRALRQETATTSLSLELGLEDIAEREVYEAIDWLKQRQRRIENKLRDGQSIIVVVRSANLRFDRGAINDYTTIID